MEEWGNARANAYYEAELPPNVHKPRDGDSVRVTERFIRDKYEHKKFIGREVPARTAR
jgi:stromal membrane-associated protein